jgi:hypothetical protein
MGQLPLHAICSRCRFRRTAGHICSETTHIRACRACACSAALVGALIVLVLAVIMLTHKLVSLKHFPEIWAEHVKLLHNGRLLADRSKQLQLERAGIHVVHSGTPSGAASRASSGPVSVPTSARTSGRNSPRGGAEPIDPHFARFAEAMAAPAPAQSASASHRSSPRPEPVGLHDATPKMAEGPESAPTCSNALGVSLVMDLNGGLQAIAIQPAVVVYD